MSRETKTRAGLTGSIDELPLFSFGGATPVNTKVETRASERQTEKSAEKSEDKPEAKPKVPEASVATQTQKTKQVLSVTQLSQQIRSTLEPQFTQVWVQGEVSNYRPAASGHLYFSLKDGGATISVANFGWGNRKGDKRNFELRDGMEVICRGKISVYVPRGNYQLIVDHIEPLGAGALQVAFEQLKEKLNAEGLFDRTKKRKLPAFPKTIAVITSPSGAAIRDMLTIMQRRAPQVKVRILPAVVQGDGAAEQISNALRFANLHQLGEVIVLARGGGSIEDLWCFNDEKLARAIAGSAIPTISAVGHEIDFTISDFVADLRAPTPSAAAEILTGAWVDSARALVEMSSRLKSLITRDLQNRVRLLEHVAARLISPKDRLRDQMQRVDELFVRLERAIRLKWERRKASLEQLMAKLDALSPLKVLERGFSIVMAEVPESQTKILVRSKRELIGAANQNQKLAVRFYDGEMQVKVCQDTPEANEG